MSNEICIICEEEFSDERLKSFRLVVKTTKVEDFARGSKANVYLNATTNGVDIYPCFTSLLTAIGPESDHLHSLLRSHFDEAV